MEIELAFNLSKFLLPVCLINRTCVLTPVSPLAADAADDPAVAPDLLAVVDDDCWDVELVSAFVSEQSGIGMLIF